MAEFEIHIPTVEELAAARAAIAQARKTLAQLERECPGWRKEAAAALARWRDR